jgi:hypothetical protein
VASVASVRRGVAGNLPEETRHAGVRVLRPGPVEPDAGQMRPQAGGRTVIGTGGSPRFQHHGRSVSGRSSAHCRRSRWRRVRGCAARREPVLA